MAMDQLAAQVEQRDGLQRRPAEEDEPLAVVFVVVATFAIQLGPIVVMRLMHEVHRHRIARQRTAQESAGHHFAADGHFEADARRFDPELSRLPDDHRMRY